MTTAQVNIDNTADRKALEMIYAMLSDGGVSYDVIDAAVRALAAYLD